MPLLHLHHDLPLSGQQGGGEQHPVALYLSDTRRPQRPPVGRMDVHPQVGAEPGRRQHYRHAPASALRLSAPRQLAKPGRTPLDDDPLTGGEPVLGRRLLQVHERPAARRVAVLVAQQPPQRHRRLQRAVDDGRPRVRAPFTGVVAREQGVLGRVAAAAVHRVAEIAVEREQERAIVVLADAAGERAVLHEVGRARIVPVRVHAEELLARERTVAEVALVERRVAPIGRPPVHHEPMVLVALERLGIARRVRRIERRDAGLLHRGVADVERRAERSLDVGAHLDGRPRHVGALAPKRVREIGAAVRRGIGGRACEHSLMLVQAAPDPGRVLVVERMRVGQILLRVAQVRFG